MLYSCIEHMVYITWLITWFIFINTTTILYIYIYIIYIYIYIIYIQYIYTIYIYIYISEHRKNAHNNGNRALPLNDF